MHIPLNRWRRPGIRAGVVLLLVAAFVLGRLTAGPGAPGGRSHPPTETAAAGQTSAPKAQVYTCSMHPQVRSPNPDDKCPICGMDLIPVPSDAEEDDAEAGAPRLSVSRRAAALMRVETWPVERRPVEIEIPLFGRINYDETRLRAIAAWVPGRLDRLYVDFTGAAVKAGDPMVSIYSPALYEAQQELLQAARAPRSSQWAADGLLGAAREKLRLYGLTARQIEAIERRGEVEDHLTLQAPVDGTVIERHATQGSYVDTGEPIYTLADLSRLWVSMEVYESDIHWLEVGQKAVFTTDVYPGEAFEGVLSFIDPWLDDRTRTVRVRADLPNPGGRLKPGMFVRGRVAAGAGAVEDRPDGPGSSSPPPLVIPVSAPLITGKRAVVYVEVPDTDRPTFEGRWIVLGPRAGDYYIVREGLREGERVVTHGNFKIDSELQIRGRPSMMAPEGGGAPVHDHGPDGTHPPAAKAPVEPTTMPLTERIDVPGAFSDRIGALVQANFSLVEALAGDDPDAARRAVAAARRALGSVDMALLDGAAHDAWMPVQGGMKQALESMAEAEDLAGIRDAFERFSDELTTAVRLFGTGSVAPVYRAVCPMVKGRKGYWLQPQEPITNPYWGEAMFRCGEIVETLVEIDTKDRT